MPAFALFAQPSVGAHSRYRPSLSALGLQEVVGTARLLSRGGKECQRMGLCQGKGGHRACFHGLQRISGSRHLPDAPSFTPPYAHEEQAEVDGVDSTGPRSLSL